MRGIFSSASWPRWRGRRPLSGAQRLAGRTCPRGFAGRSRILTIRWKHATESCCSRSRERWMVTAFAGGRPQSIVGGNFTGVVKAPIGTWLRIFVGRSVGRRSGGSRSRRRRIFRTLRGCILLGGNECVRGCARIAGGSDLAVVLIAAHYVAEREKYAGKDQHQHEQADDVPGLQDTLARATSIAARSHAYFLFPPNACTQLLMISIGSGNTIVVFFSTPISVNVCK